MPRWSYPAALMAALLASLASGPVVGAEGPTLELELVPAEGRAAEAPQAHGRAAMVVAEPLGRAAAGAAELPEARRIEVSWPGVAALALEPGFLWQLRIEADGFWTPSLTVAVEDGPPVRWRREMFATGVLQGRIETDDRTDSPEALELRVRRPPERAGPAPAGDVRTWHPLRCESGDGEETVPFECHPPVGFLDLRLSAPGTVPHYFWNVRIEEHRPLDLGNLRFRPGASVVGWIVREPPTRRDSHGTAAVTVRLEPEVARSVAPAVEERLGATGVEATADGEGFFQLEGAPPGAWALVASAPGYAPLRLPVRLAGGQETVLRDALVLRPPVAVELRVEPPLDPYGRPWRWELLRSHPVEGRLEAAGRGTVGTLGTARMEDLVPGSHLLIVEDRDGSRWLGREVEIGAGQEHLDVTLDVVALEGTLLLGDDPLSARVVFGADDAPTALRFESDEEGLFSGHLPRDGEWNVEVLDPRDGSRMRAEPVEVEERNGVAEVVVRLPDTRLEGRVVDEAGEPVPGAVLMAMLPEERRWGSQLRSDDDGAFLLRGLEPGSYLLQARSGAAASAWTPVQVEEGRPVRDVSLVLRDTVLLLGRLTGGGSPVPGAAVRVVPQRRSGPQWVEQELTDPAGEFRVEMPADTGRADLLVSPPGLPFLARRIVLEGPTTRVDLEVDPRGGRLELGGVTVDPGEGQPPSVYLLVGEVPVHLSQLRGRWRPGGAADSLVLVEMEPGPYALCSSEMLRPHPPSGPPGADCVRGYLPPLGQLRLDRTPLTNFPETEP